MRLPLIVALLTICPQHVFAGETTFVIGSRPYNFADRSRESHLTFQMRGPEWPNGGSSGGQASVGSSGYPVNSYAYSVGNWVQVDMNLAADAEGVIMIENHQDSSGDQQAVADAFGKIMETYQNEDAR